MDFLINQNCQQNEVRFFIKKTRNELHFSCRQKYAQTSNLGDLCLSIFNVTIQA